MQLFPRRAGDTLPWSFQVLQRISVLQFVKQILWLNPSVGEVALSSRRSLPWVISHVSGIWSWNRGKLCEILNTLKLSCVPFSEKSPRNSRTEDARETCLYIQTWGKRDTKGNTWGNSCRKRGKKQAMTLNECLLHTRLHAGHFGYMTPYKEGSKSMRCTHYTCHVTDENNCNLTPKFTYPAQLGFEFAFVWLWSPGFTNILYCFYCISETFFH